MEEDDTRHDSSFNDHIANEKKGIHLIEWIPFFVHHNRLLSNLKTLMERVAQKTMPRKIQTCSCHDSMTKRIRQITVNAD